MSNMENNLKEVIEGLSKGFLADIINENKELVDELFTVYTEKGEKAYLHEVQSKFLKMQMLSELPLTIVPCKYKGIIRFILDGSYDAFFKRLMIKEEGNGCCADKSRFIKNKTLLYLKTGENQSLYDTYQGCENIEKERWESQAYWSPKTIRDTNEAIELFMNWYYLK